MTSMMRQSEISKSTKMKELVSAIQDYFLTKCEDAIIIINKHLQSLSVTIDLSIFDPHTNIASQFYVSLYQLMQNMEPNSSYAWKCVDVLSNACKNPSARYSLIHTYQYIPCLSRLLSDQLSAEKKIHILRLMQDLTCGIKISWQIPHLPTLMATLTKWIKIKTSNPDIVSLALGTLVNLCYKNLPAVYTLVGQTDVREILNILNSPSATPIVALHTCKLFIILDYANGDIPEAMLVKLTKISFQAIIESYRTRDLFFLRQVVEFVLDVAKNNGFSAALEKHDFSEQLNGLVAAIDNRNAMDTGDNYDYDSTCPECIGLVLEFLNFFVEIELLAVAQLYPTLIDLALKWIHTDLVSTQALAILKSIATNLDHTENDILAPLVQGLPIFIAGIDCNKSEESMCIEDVKKVLGLLQLIKVMVRVDTIRGSILEEFQVDSMKKMFMAFLIDDSRELRNNGHLQTIEHVNMYTQAVALTHELAKCETNWSLFFDSLLLNKQIHLVLAQCLYESSEIEKNVVLGLCGYPGFPTREIAKAMCLLQPISTTQQEKRREASSVQELNLPVLSCSQNQRIDDVLNKFDDIVQGKGVSVLTSDVMELYEYKLASMASAERNAMAGVAAASERCTLLQHRNAQLTSELNRSHQLLYRSQQNREQIMKHKDTLEEELVQVKSDLMTYEEKVKKNKQLVKLKEEEVADVKRKLSEAGEEISSLKLVVAKVQSSATRLEQNLIKKDEIISKSNSTVEHLNAIIKTMENNIEDLESKLGKVTKELNEKRKIMETITRMALNSQT